MEQAFNFPIPQVQWYALAPMAVITIAGIVGLILEMVTRKHRNDSIVAVSLLGLVGAAVLLVLNLRPMTEKVLAGALTFDALSIVLQLVIVIATGLVVAFSEPYLTEKKIKFGEFYPLVMWSSVGAMLMVGTTNLLMLFIGLEILSIALYVMAGMSRREERSEESAMKYFLLGSFSGAFLLFGIAFLYGASGSLDLEQLSSAWLRNAESARMLMVFGLSLVLVGLGFKCSFVPFHQWTPDVYQGAPTNVTAFMATTAKIGAFGALWRVLYSLDFMRDLWLPILGAVAVITMLVGNLVALAQRDVKRILAYSSIANAGYVLVGILAGTSERGDFSGSSVAYFLMSYAFMTIGAFAVLSLAARDGREVTTIDDLKGLYQRSPFAAVVLVICMISLIGIPPTAGFVGKLLIFQDAVRAGLTPLAIVLAISSVISIYYYLAIATAAFATQDENAERRLARPTAVTLAACAACVAGIAGLTVFFGPVMAMLTGR